MWRRLAACPASAARMHCSQALAMHAAAAKQGSQFGNDLRRACLRRIPDAAKATCPHWLCEELVLSVGISIVGKAVDYEAFVALMLVCYALVLAEGVGPVG